MSQYDIQHPILAKAIEQADAIINGIDDGSLSAKRGDVKVRAVYSKVKSVEVDLQNRIEIAKTKEILKKVG